MGLKNRGFIMALFSIVLLLSAGEVLAAEFSAQVITIYQGQESRGQVYVKGNRIRQEFPSGSGAKIVIYNADTKMAWILRPERKMVLEMPLTEEMIRGLMQEAKDRAGMKPLGTETVNGYSSDKYETVFRENGGELRHYIWIAKKLGMIIKIDSLDKSFSREYREIKEGGVPEALLAPPPDYEKMSLPGGTPGKP
jgi:hypothetical protein